MKYCSNRDVTALALFDFLRSRVARVRTSSLARNALWMTLGQVVSLVLQAGSFILLARFLGSYEYGIFSGALAFVSLFSQYSAAGAGSVFLRYVSIDRRQATVYWGNVLFALGLAGVVLVLVMSFASHFVLNAASATLVLVLAISDCFFKQISTCAAQVFQSYEQMRITAALNAMTNAVRLATIGVLFFLVRHGTAHQWTWASATVSGFAAAVTLVIVHRKIGRPTFSPGLLKKRGAEGFGFAFAASTNSIYNDMDKTLLSHYGMNAANGIYSTAYRVIDIATMPMWSLYASALPRMFRQGENNVAATQALTRKLARTGAIAGVGMFVVCYLTAPLLPMLAGPSFHESISAIRWLGLLPFFRAFQLSAGAGLTAAGYQRLRTISQIAAAAFNFAVNLYLIPHYSWLGAAWASLATDALIGIGNWIMYLWLCARRSPTVLTQS